MTTLNQLTELGQAVWLDYIRRSFTRAGDLQALINQGVRGVTSNPAIFEQAIAGSDDYDEDIQRLAGENRSVNDIYEALAIEDIRQAADLLRPLYDRTDGRDGYVSLEVSPALAHDTAGTVADAKRLFVATDRANLMIKIPATPEGIPAIESVIAAGINVNVTLIFSLAQYEAAAWAYINGLEKLQKTGRSLGQTASVASFFISRVDTAVDAALEKIGRSDLQGTTAIDNARLAYTRFREIFIDHGRVSLTIEKDVAGARSRIATLADIGISLETITRQLLDAGVAAFAVPFDNLMKSLEEKRDRLSGSGNA